MRGEWFYEGNGWKHLPPDVCGYRQQADRIDDYQARNTPESVVPFIRDNYAEGGHPDGCSICGKATWWEYRTLPNGEQQMRCSECRDSITR
mgnify:CR=1 FL=1